MFNFESSFSGLLLTLANAHSAPLANPFQENSGLIIFWIVLGVGILMMLVERVGGGRDWPKVRGWRYRTALVNVSKVRALRSRPLFRVSLSIVVIAGTWSASANAYESARAELSRLQKEQGLSLVALATAADTGGNGPRDRESIDTVVFGRHSLSPGKQLLSPGARADENGSISPDGSEVALNLYSDPENPKTDRILAIIGRDGHLVRSYPYLVDGSDFCWSPDNSKLALRAINKRVNRCNWTLQVLDLKSGLTEQVDTNEAANPFSRGAITSQCWSPDGKHLVYALRTFNDNQIRRYDEDQKTSVPLEGVGWGASWSPNGEWISFFVGDDNYAAGGTYYVVSPDGAEPRKALFYQRYAVAPLWWSPDSRFVAYKTWAGLLERFAMGPKYIPTVFDDLLNLDLGNGPMRLRVRRVDDNSDTPVFTIETGSTTYNGQEWGTHGPWEFQWLTGLNPASD